MLRQLKSRFTQAELDLVFKNLGTDKLTLIANLDRLWLARQRTLGQKLFLTQNQNVVGKWEAAKLLQQSDIKDVERAIGVLKIKEIRREQFCDLFLVFQASQQVRELVLFMMENL